MTRYDIQNEYKKQYGEKQKHVIYKLADSFIYLIQMEALI